MVSPDAAFFASQVLFEKWDKGDKKAAAALVLFKQWDGADKS